MFRRVQHAMRKLQEEADAHTRDAADLMRAARIAMERGDGPHATGLERRADYSASQATQCIREALEIETGVAGKGEEDWGTW